MIVTHIIFAVSTLAWFVAIFKQKNSTIFLYFLITGVSDPLTLLFGYSLGLPSGVIYSFQCIALYIVFRFKDFKSIKLKLFDYPVFLIFIYVVITFSYMKYFFLGIHLFILIKVIQRMITSLHFHGEVNVFFLVLVFYEISLLLKTIIFLSGTVAGVYLFYLTLAFQILIAIFFIIFREDNPMLTIKLIPSEKPQS